MAAINWTVVRVSTLVKKLKLPRPKIVRTVLFSGTKEGCEDFLKELKKDLKPVDKSTDDIKVDLLITKNGRNTTSARPGNGQR
jgi:hypothetical protein